MPAVSNRQKGEGMSEKIGGGYDDYYQSKGISYFNSEAGGSQAVEVSQEDTQFSDRFLEKSEKHREDYEILHNYMDKIYTRVKSGDTEAKYHIGSRCLTEQEWDRLLKSFSSAEAAIKNLVDVEIEERKKIEEAKRSGRGQEERISVNNGFFAITRGADYTMQIYDKMTGYSYTFLEDYLSVQRDETTKEVFLISDMPYTPMNVEVMRFVPELKKSVEQYRGGEPIEVKPLDSKFTLTMDLLTGIGSLHWRAGQVQASVMLLSNVEQKNKLEELSRIYLAHYPNIVSDKSGAKMRAVQEAMGNARRTANGIVTITGNALNYDDDRDYGMKPPSYAHCWTYFFDMEKIDASYMEYISSLRKFMLSMTTESLEDEESVKRNLQTME
jgi:hypothetical protein